MVMAAAVALLSGVRAKADDADQGHLFHNNEVSLDLFGTYLNQERHLSKIFDTSIRHGNFGGGVGLNYFPIQFVGVGVDTSFQTRQSDIVDHVAGNLILRLPIEVAHLAPYIFGGGGHKFDPIDQSFADAGVGLEVRFTRNIGMFGDVRYVWNTQTKPVGLHDEGLFRLGMKFAF